MAALGALALMIITVIICLIKIFNGAAERANVQPYPDMPPVEVPPPNYVGLVSFIIFLLVVFGVVLLLSLREQRRAETDEINSKNKKKISLRSFF
jgi:ABC-type Fe3+ transport system permease subunit